VVPLRKLPSYFLLLFFLFAGGNAIAQKPIDPCFESLKPGRFWGSDYIRNKCFCDTPDKATDLLEWNGSTWIGKIVDSQVGILPPEGSCNMRAIWMGYPDWTDGGEAFALKLDKPFEIGTTYTFTFTYASDGKGADGNFAPRVRTVGGPWAFMSESFIIGRMPAAGYEWKTASFTFTASQQQRDHDWLILHADISSGIVLSNCEVTAPVTVTADTINHNVCYGDSVRLYAPVGPYYHYEWNTGDTTRFIDVAQSGEYAVSIINYQCKNDLQPITVDFADCEVRMEMPNVFTPNGDDKNEVFKPMETNFVASGKITIYNRWGNKIITTDLLTGWDGKVGNTRVAPGVYYYNGVYVDLLGGTHKVKGNVEVILQ
jgi:gliding motility-associated-like protein